MKRIMVRTATLMVGCIALSVGIASAATVEAPTVITKFKLSADADARKYWGRVASTKSRCEKNRKVKVVRKMHGNEKVLASGRTDSQGKFRIERSGGKLSRGKYYTKVKQSSSTKNGDKIICKKGKSGTIKV
ncbi:MAG: hypothetical protein WBC01_03740 [Solirubrobacterales bacterium]